MRILYCNKYSFPFSGAEKYLFELMDLMQSKGHETALFSMENEKGYKHPYEHHFVPKVDFKNGRWRQRVRAAMGAVYSRKARQHLRAMLREFKPDVAHVRNIYHYLSPSILWELKAHKIPVLYHLNDFKLLCPSYNMVSHGHACERCVGGNFWHVLTEGCYSGPHGASTILAVEAYIHKWFKTYEKCVDRFLAPSEFVKQKLVGHGWDESKIDVLPHFQKMPTNISVPSSDAPILYFGRLSPEKGIMDLLEAMKFLPHVKLQIAGEGPQKAQLQQKINTLQLKNVEFIGHLQGHALEQTIAASRFTAMPSRAYETFGKSIVESFAQARAVVASDLGSRRELIQDGQTGLLYPVGDAAKLAKAIATLIERPELTIEMGNTAKELVRTRYSPETHYSNLLFLYESLIQQRTRTRKKSLPAHSPKIAFIGGRGVISKYSGIETYYEEVGKRLAAKGHEVTAYCRNYFTPKVKQYEQMRIVRLPAIRTKHLETFTHSLLSTIYAMFGSYDIIHYHALGPALFSFFPRLMGKKTVVTVQGLDWQRKKWGHLAKYVLRIAERAAVRCPNKTMVVSRVLQNYYRARYKTETLFVPNGTSVRSSDTASRLQQWGLAKKEYILFLGRFSPEKNCHLLIEAYKRIRTSTKLVMAGGSSHSDAYVAALRKQTNENIIMLDWVSGPALDELLSNAMLFVLPSDLEGMSLALLDAMSAGVCVLASDIPENNELVDGAGFTFAKGNVSELEKMLRFLINNPGLREAKARLGQQKVHKSYLWGQVTDAVERVYIDLMDPHEKPIFLPSVVADTQHKRAA